jgi:hypothetical protein
MTHGGVPTLGTPLFCACRRGEAPHDTVMVIIRCTMTSGIPAVCPIMTAK